MDAVLGLAADIHEAIEQRLRGLAGDGRARAMRCIMARVQSEVLELVVDVSDALDEEFEGKG